MPDQLGDAKQNNHLPPDGSLTHEHPEGPCSGRMSIETRRPPPTARVCMAEGWMGLTSSRAAGQQQ